MRRGFVEVKKGRFQTTGEDEGRQIKRGGTSSPCGAKREERILIVVHGEGVNQDELYVMIIQTQTGITGNDWYRRE